MESVNGEGGGAAQGTSVYNAFFGFRESPFDLTPDPYFLFPSRQYEEALANLVYGVRSRKGFVVLTGEVGTGKTTMLECLRNQMEQARNVSFAHLFNSRLTPAEFFEMLAYDLELPGDHKSKTSVLFALNEFLIAEHAKGRIVVLAVDEAHNLSWDVLEEIRMLGNLETRHGKLLQVVLAGQPELDRKLDAPDLRQFKQRIVLRCTLQPLSQADTAEYVASRLKTAGMETNTLFPPEVLREIHIRSQGVPRVVNAICDNLLVNAFAQDSRATTLGMIEEVTSDLRLDWPGRRRNGLEGDFDREKVTAVRGILDLDPHSPER